MNCRKTPLTVISLFTLFMLLLGSAPLGPASAVQGSAAAELEATGAGYSAGAETDIPTSLRCGMGLSPVQLITSTSINQSLDSVTGLRFTYAQYYLSWKDVEPHKDEIRWDWLNPIVAQASIHSVKLVFRIYQTPRWAKTPADSPYPADPVELARFVQALIGRYGSLVAGYVIWNEPNTLAGWEGHTINAQGYWDMLYEVHKGAKAISGKSNTIISAGLAPTLGGPYTGAVNDISYLDALYKRPAKNGHTFKDLADVIGMNGFGFEHDPDDTTDPNQLNFGRLAALRQVMVNNGDAAKAAYALEVGWVARPNPDKTLPGFDDYKVTESQQAQYLSRAIAKACDWTWLKAVFIWNLDFGADASEPEKEFFAIRDRPAYGYLQVMWPLGCPRRTYLPLLLR